jgi:hypothetical protein
MNQTLQLDRAALEALCRQFGADDVGFADLEGEALAAQRASVARALPWARTVMVFVRRMNRHPIRAPFRTLASAEFIEAAHDVKTTIHRTVRTLEDRKAIAPGWKPGFSLRPTLRRCSPASTWCTRRPKARAPSRPWPPPWLKPGSTRTAWAI